MTHLVPSMYTLRNLIPVGRSGFAPWPATTAHLAQHPLCGDEQLSPRSRTASVTLSTPAGQEAAYKLDAGKADIERQWIGLYGAADRSAATIKRP